MGEKKNRCHGRNYRADQNNVSMDVEGVQESRQKIVTKENKLRQSRGSKYSGRNIKLKLVTSGVDTSRNKKTEGV